MAETVMSTVLVVDDSAVDRKIAGSLLEQESRVVSAADGQEALSAMEHQLPDVVLTDMQMPVIDGLQLVEEVRSRYPSVPVILMTAHGSEEIAVEALRKGATSYVSKKRLAQVLPATVRDVLALAHSRRGHRELLECVTESQTCFRLHNSPNLIQPLLSNLQENLDLMQVCDDETGLLRIGVALCEALNNALYHGNLELSSSLLWQNDETRDKLVDERREQSPYRERHIYVTSKLSRSEAVFVVCDEGPGFDPAALPDPTDPANIEKACGRGVLLMRTFMDEVGYNDAGNEVTMVKRRALPETTP